MDEAGQPQLGLEILQQPAARPPAGLERSPRRNTTAHETAGKCPAAFSREQNSAIHDDLATRHVRRQVRGQEQGDLADIVGLTHPSHWIRPRNASSSLLMSTPSGTCAPA